MADRWSPDRRFERFSRFGALPNFDWYEKIYEFLSDEKRVSRGLDQLGGETSSAAAFMAGLARIETDNKFASPIEIVKLEYGDVFMSYIRARRPINDRGVLPAHGVLTHRIQWALCALELRSALPASLSVAELYAGLGRANASVPRDPESDGTSIGVGGASIALWSVLVDSPYVGTNKKWRVCNARSPEYLMAYLHHHPNAVFRQMHAFSDAG